MKNSYMSVSSKLERPWFWLLLLVGLWLPIAAQAQTVVITPTIQDFGSVSIGATSAPISFTYSVDGAKSNPVIVNFANTAPSFEGSSNNGATYTQSLSLPAQGGTFLIRFRPTAVGPTSGEFLSAATGRGASSFVDLSGTGVAGPANIAVNPTALAFGNQLVNTPSSSQTIAVTATSLTEAITVTPPQGFEVSTDNANFFTILTLPQASGAVNTTLFVRFRPTVVQPYVSGITFTSAGATTRITSVSGTGVAPNPTLTVSPTSLTSFGSVSVGQASPAQSFTVTGNNLVGNVTIAPPANFQIRLPNGTFSTANITLTGSTINQVIEVRFQPTSNGNKSGNVQVSSAGVTTANVSVSGQGAQPNNTPTITASPTSIDFGAVSGSGSIQTLRFEVGGISLNAPLVLTASNANISFRDATAGGSFTSGPLVINPVNNTVPLRIIEVRLVAVVAGGPFVGNITASSTGATPVVVEVKATNTVGGSSTINTTGVLQQFSTVPNVPSAVQSYQVAASNLLQDVTVTAPLYFQVSLTPDFDGINTTGNSIVVQRNNGNDIFPAVRVYVRFLPPIATTSSDLVTNNSLPATGQGIPVAGTSVPSIQVQNAFQEVRNVIINETSGVQTLNIQADRVRQPITITRNVISNTANPSNTAQFELSLDNQNFSSAVVINPSATTFSVNAPVYVRYRPTYLGAAQSVLQYQSSDFSNTATQNFTVNGELLARSIDTEPTERSVATVTRNGNTATVTFNLPANYVGLGYGENRLVVASTNPTLPAGSQPADGTPYGTGNQTYGSGPQVVPGYYVVYSGDEASVTVSGLDPTVTYYIYTFEFNNIESSINLAIVGAENYLQPPVPTTITGIIAPGIPLPVSLVSFTAKLRNKQVVLDWKTATEKNNGMFYVERSQDGRTFASILSQKGQGTTEKATTYSAVDTAPLAGTSYYRLKQVDFDGTTAYSSAVVVNAAGSVEVTMFPNPVQDVLNIQLGTSTQGLRATITDLSGRVVRTQVLSGNGQLNVQDLRSGTYFVTVGEGSSKVTQRIVKQ